MSRADDLRAELALAELEDELVAAKADDKTTDAKFRDIKNKLREARAAHRQSREG